MATPADGQSQSTTAASSSLASNTSSSQPSVTSSPSLQHRDNDHSLLVEDSRSATPTVTASTATGNPTSQQNVSDSDQANSSSSTPKLASAKTAGAGGNVKKPTFKSVSVNKKFLKNAPASSSSSPSTASDALRSPFSHASSLASPLPASRPRLVAKTTGPVSQASLPKFATISNGGRGNGVPDPNAVWNKNRPTPPPPDPVKMTDEQLQKEFGIHVAARLSEDTSKDSKEKNWADIDDDDDDDDPWADWEKSGLPMPMPIPPDPSQCSEPVPKDGTRNTFSTSPSSGIIPPTTATDFNTEDQERQTSASKSPLPSSATAASSGTRPPGSKTLVLKSASTTAAPKPSSPWASLPTSEKPSPIILTRPSEGNASDAAQRRASPERPGSYPPGGRGQSYPYHRENNNNNNSYHRDGYRDNHRGDRGGYQDSGHYYGNNHHRFAGPPPPHRPYDSPQEGNSGGNDESGYHQNRAPWRGQGKDGGARGGYPPPNSNRYQSPAGRHDRPPPGSHHYPPSGGDRRPSFRSEGPARPSILQRPHPNQQSLPPSGVQLDRDGYRDRDAQKSPLSPYAQPNAEESFQNRRGSNLSGTARPNFNQHQQQQQPGPRSGEYYRPRHDSFTGSHDSRGSPRPYRNQPYLNSQSPTDAPYSHPGPHGTNTGYGQNQGSHHGPNQSYHPRSQQSQWQNQPRPSPGPRHTGLHPSESSGSASGFGDPRTNSGNGISSGNGSVADVHIDANSPNLSAPGPVERPGFSLDPQQKKIMEEAVRLRKQEEERLEAEKRERLERKLRELEPKQPEPTPSTKLDTVETKSSTDASTSSHATSSHPSAHTPRKTSLEQEGGVPSREEDETQALIDRIELAASSSRPLSSSHHPHPHHTTSTSSHPGPITPPRGSSFVPHHSQNYHQYSSSFASSHHPVPRDETLPMTSPMSESKRSAWDVATATSSTWGARSQPTASYRNVWASPSSDRSLGNGTFQTEIGPSPSEGAKPPAPIGPPSRSISSTSATMPHLSSNSSNTTTTAGPTATSGNNIGGTSGGNAPVGPGGAQEIHPKPIGVRNNNYHQNTQPHVYSNQPRSHYSNQNTHHPNPNGPVPDRRMMDSRQNQWVAAVLENDRIILEEQRREALERDRQLQELGQTVESLQPTIQNTWRGETLRTASMDPAPVKLYGQSQSDHSSMEKTSTMEPSPSTNHGNNPASQSRPSRFFPQPEILSRDGPSLDSSQSNTAGVPVSVRAPPASSAASLGLPANAPVVTVEVPVPVHVHVPVPVVEPLSSSGLDWSGRVEAPPPLTPSHPVYDGDARRPHVSLPFARDSVNRDTVKRTAYGESVTGKAPKHTVQTQTQSQTTQGPPAPVTWTSVISRKKPQVSGDGTVIVQPARVTTTSTGGIVSTANAPAESVKKENWQDKINSLLTGRSTRSQSEGHTMHAKQASTLSRSASSSQSVQEALPPQQQPKLWVLDGLARASAAFSSEAITKPMAEECFEAQEMGSLPTVRLPSPSTNAYETSPVAMTNVKPLPRRHMVIATSKSSLGSYGSSGQEEACPSMIRVHLPTFSVSRTVPFTKASPQSGSGISSSRGGRWVSRYRGGTGAGAGNHGDGYRRRNDDGPRDREYGRRGSGRGRRRD